VFALLTVDFTIAAGLLRSACLHVLDKDLAMRHACGHFVFVFALLMAAASGVKADDPVRDAQRIIPATPRNENGLWPKLLSEARAFTNLKTLETSGRLIPYDLNVPFWSDAASKRRWIMLPAEGKISKISFSPAGEWRFPSGTIFIKHFEMVRDERDPKNKRRLETRFLIVNETGGVFGATYKWRADESDAELLQTNLVESITIKTTSGERTQNWYYPSRADCLTCHTPNAGGVLGVNARQLNREFSYPHGSENQLRHWSRLDLFEPALTEEQIASAPKLARADDSKASIQERARSWLDANCAHCHRPGGTVAAFDARYKIPLAEQGLINAPVLIDQGIDGARVIAPNDIWRSILFMRVNTVEPFKMPPLAHETVDRDGVELLKAWIQSLPGTAVLDPPAIQTRGGEYRKRVLVNLSHPDAQTTLRYTLDGSVPGKSAAVYAKPIELTESTTLRVKAFKDGFTKSITAQETFVITE
jgi:uncharacterized repeat protein (TIGR03806 family)